MMKKMANLNILDAQFAAKISLTLQLRCLVVTFSTENVSKNGSSNITNVLSAAMNFPLMTQNMKPKKPEMIRTRRIINKAQSKTLTYDAQYLTIL